MTAFLLIFLVGSQLENYLLSTGAFEVYLNGECEHVVGLCQCCVCCTAEQQVWSKLSSGRLPSLGEMKGMIDDISPSAGMSLDSET